MTVTAPTAGTAGTAGTGERPVRRHARCMGSVASVHVHDDLDPRLVDGAVDEVFVELERLEAMFSTFRPDSAVSRINGGDLHLLDAPPEVLDVLDACTWLEHVSEGAFSVHPPEHPATIDPAGFVKGWATERAARCLLEAGLEHWYVSVGGDLQTHGCPAPGQPWRVAIADPFEPGSAVAALEVRGGAVATSGTAERGGHLWDGRRRVRFPAIDAPDAGAELASMTVLGPHLAWADAFATAAFAMGLDGLAWVEQFDDHQAVAVTSRGHVVASRHFAATSIER